MATNPCSSDLKFEKGDRKDLLKVKLNFPGLC